MQDVLHKIFQNPTDVLTIFSEEELSSLKFINREQDKWYVISETGKEEERLVYSQKKNCPEEIVRQLFVHRLMTMYKYPKRLIKIEQVVNFGREQKRADIVVYKDDLVTPYIIIETKAPNEKNDVKQLKSYLNAEGAEIGVAVNGQTQEILYRPYPKDFSSLPNIPEYRQTPEDVFEKEFTYKTLKEPRQLKQTIQNLEDMVLANSGYDSFDEIFKIIYAKIYDEIQGMEDPDNYSLKFRAGKDNDETKSRIEDLFEKAKDEWKDIFEDSDRIKLRASQLASVVANLQEFKFMGSDLQIIDDTFEYLIPDVAKGKKGQYFTPRHVIDMCVTMLNPLKTESVIDTACGSGGFLIHALKYVKNHNNFTKSQLKSYSNKHLWGIDFDDKSSKISKAMMLIAGDGKTHIFKENSLDSDSWNSRIKNALEDEKLVKSADFQNFQFDVLLANPPFAGEVNEERILKLYPNVVKDKQKSISRHLLFIERNLNFVREGGRLALVLPQGVFNNTSEKYIRDFLADKARILAVVGLDVNTFKPHTGTKTSVIFLQKWDKTDCPKVEDYNIFFAVSEQSGKNNSGEYVYKEIGGERVLQHDLKDIADAFVEFAKREKFSFWKE